MRFTEKQWRDALQRAAEAAYEAEIVDTGMQSLTIGPGLEAATRREWVELRMEEWLSPEPEPETPTQPALHREIAELTERRVSAGRPQSTTETLDPIVRDGFAHAWDSEPKPRALATLEAWLDQNPDYIIYIDSPGPERPAWRCEIAHEFSDSVFGYGGTMLTALSDAFLRFNSEAEALRRTWNAKTGGRK